MRLFAENFEPTEAGSLSDPQTMRELLHLIIERPSQREEILGLWHRLFPQDIRIYGLLD
jgi:hypothetical protein